MSQEQKYMCRECGEVFSEQVWHCVHCDHHYHAEDDKCGNCHEAKGDAQDALPVKVLWSNY